MGVVTYWCKAFAARDLGARGLGLRQLGEGSGVGSSARRAGNLGNPVPWETLPTILVIEFLSIAFVEHQCSMEKDPEKRKYPSGAFDPSGYSKDPEKLKELKAKEKNG